MRARIRNGSITVDGLEKMLEKQMQADFGASRDTCRKARDEILSEFVDNSFRDK
jgi:hypothetical protein